MPQQEQSSRVELGQEAPDFNAQDLRGEKVSLKSQIENQKTLLLFYRGGWCPICNKQLAGLAQDYDKFRALNTKIVAVSSDEPQKGEELLKKLRLPYTLLSDPNFEAIDRYSVKTENRDMLSKMKRIKSYATPSAFIIDEQGIIRYKYVGKDAGDRPKNEELLEKLKEI